MKNPSSPSSSHVAAAPVLIPQLRVEGFRRTWRAATCYRTRVPEHVEIPERGLRPLIPEVEFGQITTD